MRKKMIRQLKFSFDDGTLVEDIKENSLYKWCLDNHQEYLIEEYDPSNHISSKIIARSCNSKVRWICSKCGNKWLASPSHRTIGRGCPKCAKNKSAEKYSTVKNFKDSVAAKYPVLVKEWSSKNSRGPETYFPNSNKKVIWLCSKCHYEFEATISKRCSRNQGCPICANLKIVRGFNDLFTTNPELQNEWDGEKNNIDPNTIGRGSRKKVWWKCQRGHSWKAVVYTRTSTHPSGCPKCCAEKSTSLPEKVVYFYIKKYFDDAIENYHDAIFKKLELDIYIPSLKVGIEYDGSNWHKSNDRDLKKDNLCFKTGIKLFRLRENGLSIYDTNAVLIETPKYKNDYLYLENPLKDLLFKLGISNPKICIRDDYNCILSNYLSYQKDNCVKNHSMFNEWDEEKNKGINPEFISIHSNRRLHWKCKTCQYEWMTSPAHRARGHKCPVCSGVQLKQGVNDLLTCNPELAKEFSNKNDFGPEEITAKNNKKVWWKCSKCGNEWEATVNSRSNGCGCPECKKISISKKLSIATYEESLLCKYKDIASEWNMEKNSITPDKVYAYSNYKYWWKCSKNHEWKAAVYSRTHDKRNCPYCSGRFAIKGVNDLKTLYPDLANEWDETKNGTSAEEVKPGSRKKAWWICSKCGHSWEQWLSVRIRGTTRCPACKNKVNIKK